MKKSLLLISVFCTCLLLSFCKNTKTQKTGAAYSENTNSFIAKDTTKVSSQQTSASGIGSGNGIKKDTTAKITKSGAIIHKAAEQEKIDSIKNAKLKGKKN